MNETYNPASPSQSPWSSNDHREGMSDTSTFPGGENGSTGAAGMLKSAVHGAHDTIDRFADSAEPAARRLSERVAAAGETLQARTDQLRDTRDEWVEGMRGTVRRNPLVSLAAAVTIGAVIARITR